MRASLLTVPGSEQGQQVCAWERVWMRAAPLLPAVFALCPSSAEAGNGRADADEAVADSSRRGRSSLVFVCAHGFAFSFFSFFL